jgi:hypothetical protein
MWKPGFKTRLGGPISKLWVPISRLGFQIWEAGRLGLKTEKAEFNQDRTQY